MGGPYPLANLDQGVQICWGSKSAVTPVHILLTIVALKFHSGTKNGFCGINNLEMDVQQPERSATPWFYWVNEKYFQVLTLATKV